MANSNTEHSKKLRAKTAAKWTKENTKLLGIRYNKKDPNDIALIETFSSIDADSNKGRLKILVDYYSKV